MNNKPYTPKLARAQLKCSKCRQVVPPKDGRWVSQKTGQAFVCKSCESTDREREDGRAQLK